ncbi:MAG: hypothetical protein WCI04_03650 [archaeon]
MSSQKPLYNGPVLFIVHAPTLLTDWRSNDVHIIKQISVANERIILGAMNKAGLRGIPVIYSPNKDNQVAETLKRVKHPPQIVNLLDPNMKFSSKNFEDVLKRNNISPTKITLLGQRRNVCVFNWAQAAKNAFPQSEVTIIEGAGTMPGPLSRSSQGERRNLNELIAYFRIKRAKKLSAKRHLSDAFYAPSKKIKLT